MKWIIKIVISIVIVFSFANSQEWVIKMIENNPSLKSKSDSLVSVLRHEYHKAIGTPAPTFSFQCLEKDTTQRITDFRNNVIIVNLWATNCGACRREMPDLSHLQDSLYEKGLRVIFLSPESKETIIKYFTEYKINGIKGIIDINQLKQPYQMLARPSSFLVDRDGIVRDVWIGQLYYYDLLKRVTPFFQNK